jgi:hypothetical protein
MQNQIQGQKLQRIVEHDSRMRQQDFNNQREMNRRQEEASRQQPRRPIQCTSTSYGHGSTRTTCY